MSVFELRIYAPILVVEGSSFGKKLNELSAKSEQALFRSFAVLDWALFKSNWVKRFFSFVTLITVLPCSLRNLSGVIRSTKVLNCCRVLFSMAVLEYWVKQLASKEP